MQVRLLEFSQNIILTKIEFFAGPALRILAKYYFHHKLTFLQVRPLGFLQNITFLKIEFFAGPALRILAKYYFNQN